MHTNSRPVQDSQSRTEAAQNSSSLQTVMVSYTVGIYNTQVKVMQKDCGVNLLPSEKYCGLIFVISSCVACYFNYGLLFTYYVVIVVAPILWGVSVA